MVEVGQDGIANSAQNEFKFAVENTVLFPPATPEQQITACNMFLYGIIMEELRGNGKTNASIKELLEFVGKVYRSELIHNKAVASELVKLTGDVLDIVDIDLISTKQQGLKVRYQRELGMKKGPDFYMGKYRGENEWNFMTPAELQKLLVTHGHVDKGPLNLDTFDYQGSNEFIFPKPVDVSTLHKIEDLWYQKVMNGQEESAVWIVPFVLDDSVGGAYCLTYKSKNFLIRPRSELPVQDVARAYLQNGVGTIGGLSQESDRSTQSEPMTKESFENGVREVWKNLRTNIPQDERPALSLYLKKNYLNKFPTEEVSAPAIEHYKREFGQERGLGPADMIITRSGVSANGVAIDIGKTWVGGDSILVIEGPGWYFENSLVNAPDSQLRSASSVDQAQILLTNAEPNAPQGDNPDTFFRKRNTIITDFLTRARNNPTQHFALVVDKTADPEFHPEELGEVWPKNLKLVETMSLTKHQRSGRGYFYGMVLSHGLSIGEDQIHESLLRNRGEMTVHSWIGIPKVTRQEMIIRRQNISRSVRSTADYFQAKAKTAGLILEPYSYYFFLYPESALLLNSQPLPAGETKGVPDLIETKAKDLQRQILKNGNYSTVEYGDSYNLDKTRITVFEGLQINGEPQEFPGVLRISPGASSPLEEVDLFTHEYIQGWATQPQS